MLMNNYSTFDYTRINSDENTSQNSISYYIKEIVKFLIVISMSLIICFPGIEFTSIVKNHKNIKHDLCEQEFYDVDENFINLQCLRDHNVDIITYYKYTNIESNNNIYKKLCESKYNYNMYGYDKECLNNNSHFECIDNDVLQIKNMCRDYEHFDNNHEYYYNCKNNAKYKDIHVCQQNAYFWFCMFLTVNVILFIFAFTPNEEVAKFCISGLITQVIIVFVRVIFIIY